MARIVMKFGGTTVADVTRIQNAAQRIKAEVDAGHQVAAAVSAMAGVTNQLVDYVDQVARISDLREYDVVVSSGEQAAAGLLAIALQEMGVAARSWLGWQVPVHTNDAHGSARIESIDVDDILRRMDDGQVAIVAGFQGVAPDGRITTLGRGGTDTSAVALAAALGAERCDIYTDVDGVYTSDPRIVTKARKLDRITYEEMLEMASVGAKVLQTRSVELAMKHGVRVQVLSAFEPGPGTLVVDEDEIVEKAIVSGIAYSRDEAKITLRQVQDRPGVGAGPARRCGGYFRAPVQIRHQRRHDRPERVDRGQYHRSHLYRGKGGIRARPQGHRGQLRTPGLRRAVGRSERGEGLGDRRRHAQPRGCGAADVHGVGRKGHQYPGH
jgi:aspartate kinase